MKNIETKIEELRKEFNSKLDDILKPKFEVGKWYKLTENYAGTLKKGEVYQMINFQADSKICIILDHVAFGINGRNYLAPYKDMLIEATPKEVEEALIKEAEKRYKIGDKIKSLDNYDFHIIGGFEFDFYQTENDMTIVSDESEWNEKPSNPTIFKNGKWAEIVKTKTIDEIARDLSALSKNGIINYMSSTENKQDIINALNNL